MRRTFAAGDHDVVLGGTLVASVERKSLPDLVSSIASGRLRFALGDLAALPRAAVSPRPVRWPSGVDVPLPRRRVVLGARRAGDRHATRRCGTRTPRRHGTEPSTAELRAWARAEGIEVPDRGRLRPEVWARYREAHASTGPGGEVPG